MTAPLIAPLIPPRARPGAREHGRAVPARRLPMAVAPEVPAVPGEVVYGRFAVLERRGRLRRSEISILPVPEACRSYQG